MTYSQWADEYLESANLIQSKIDSLKKQLDTAPVSELKDLNCRISIMYQMYLDCIKTADLLRKRKGVAF